MIYTNSQTFEFPLHDLTHHKSYNHKHYVWHQEYIYKRSDSEDVWILKPHISLP